MGAVSEDDIIRLSNQYGLPPELALAIYSQESSGGSNTKTSPQGAVGGFQVTPVAYKDVGGKNPDELKDPLKNAEYGIKYLAKGYAQSGTYEGAAAFYHAGPQWQNKLATNPDLSDSLGEKTTDYMASVADKASALKDKLVGKVKNAFTPSPAPAPAPQTESAAMPNTSTVPDTPITNSGMDITQDLGPGAPRAASNEETQAAIDASLPAGEQLKRWAQKPQSSADEIFNKIGATLDQIILSGDTLAAKTKDALATEVAGIQKEGDLQATVATEAFRQQSQKASANAAQLSRLGINTDDTDSLVAELSTNMQQREREALAQRANIRKYQNTGILDNPIDYVIGQLALPGLINEHNQTVQDVAAMKDYIDGATATADKVAASNSTKYATTTAAGAVAAADLARTQANVHAAQVQEQLLKVDYTAQLDKLRALDGVANTMRAAREEDERNQVRQDNATRKQQADAEQAIIDQRVRAAAQVLGLTVQNQKDLQKQPKEVQTAIENVSLNGGNKIGSTPYEVTENLSHGDINAMAPATREMAQFMMQARKDAEQEILRGQFAGASKTIQTEQINKIMSDKLATYVKNPNKVLQGVGDDTKPSPFKIPDIEIMAKDPTAAQLRITKLILDQKTATPLYPISDNMIQQLAFQAVGKPDGYKDITEAAKDVSNYYKAGVAANNSIYRFDSFGLPEQRSYQNGKQDLTKYSDVMSGLIQQQRMKLLMNPSAKEAIAQGKLSIPGNAGVFGDFQDTTGGAP